jgi:hypothetical protein
MLEAASAEEELCIRCSCCAIARAPFAEAAAADDATFAAVAAPAASDMARASSKRPASTAWLGGAADMVDRRCGCGCGGCGGCCGGAEAAAAGEGGGAGAAGPTAEGTACEACDEGLGRGGDGCSGRGGSGRGGDPSAGRSWLGLWWSCSPPGAATRAG